MDLVGVSITDLSASASDSLAFKSALDFSPSSSSTNLGKRVFFGTTPAATNVEGERLARTERWIRWNGNMMAHLEKPKHPDRIIRRNRPQLKPVPSNPLPDAIHKSEPEKEVGNRHRRKIEHIFHRNIDTV